MDLWVSCPPAGGSPVSRPGRAEVFPCPVAVPTIPCRACRTPTRVDRAVQGYGRDCAEKRGLITVTTRLRASVQDGPDLLDILAEEPEDECDGWDR